MNILKTILMEIVFYITPTKNKKKKKSVSIFMKFILWGPIDPISTVHVEKDWAYGPISSPRIGAYPRTISKGRNENCFIGRGKEYLWRT